MDIAPVTKLIWLGIVDIVRGVFGMSPGLVRAGAASRPEGQ
jgi:hypothetical protein